MTLHCRITKIDIERFQVELTSKTSDLVDADNKWKYVMLSYLLSVSTLKSSFTRNLSTAKLHRVKVEGTITQKCYEPKQNWVQSRRFRPLIAQKYVDFCSVLSL